jgi:hypothetical protein
MNARRASLFACILLFMALGWGVVRLIELRFARGDIYPPYSTLRADPLGTRAVFDAYAEIPGFTTERNFRPLHRLGTSEPITLIYAGVKHNARWLDPELETFERLVRSGSRSAFIFRFAKASTSDTRATTGTPRGQRANPTPTPPPAPGTTPRPKTQRELYEEDLPGIAFRDVAADWGFAFDFSQAEARETLHTTAERTPEAPAHLETSIPWHSALYFKSLTPEWTVLYRAQGVPVIIERRFGSGSIIAASDTWFFSNEGLRESLAPALVAHIIGPPRRILFDEEHHGIAEQSNIAGLARKYRLEGALAAIGLVVALYLWSHAMPLLPARTSPRPDDADLTGAGASEGFVNLLRRCVGKDSVLKACAEAWIKSQGLRINPQHAAHIDAVLRGHGERGLAGKNAVQAYHTIAQGLRHHTSPSTSSIATPAPRIT